MDTQGVATILEGQLAGEPNFTSPVFLNLFNRIVAGNYGFKKRINFQNYSRSRDFQFDGLRDLTILHPPKCPVDF